MVGIAGRSGKARTPEERAAKRANAKLGGMTAAGRFSDYSPGPKSEAPQHSAALLAAYPELSGYPFPVTDALMLKDALENINKQAKARQADVELDEAKTKRDIARGKLLTADQVRARDEATDEYVLGQLPALVEMAVKLHPLGDQAEIRRQLNAKLGEWRSAVALGIRALRKPH